MRQMPAQARSAWPAFEKPELQGFRKLQAAQDWRPSIRTIARKNVHQTNGYQASKQAAATPGASVRNAGTSREQRASAIGQRV